MRIITAVAGLSSEITVLTGDDSIRTRPMQPLLDALQQVGVKAWSTRSNGLAPIVVEGGGLKGGEVAIRGDVSSQFITALLLVTPLGENDCRIRILGDLVSRPYIEITLEMLDVFGQAKCDKFTISSTVQYVDNYFASDNEQDSIPSFFVVNAKVTYEIYKGLQNG